jgi:hypothetical protein
MFNYTVKVLHNGFKNKFRIIKVTTASQLLKIHAHFDVWTAIPTKEYKKGADHA